jgi:DNA-binding XRE family transcriptional regulator
MNANQFATVQHDGVVTHVLVPAQDFEHLTGISLTGQPARLPPGTFAWSPTAAQADFARGILNSPSTRWESADAIMMQLVADGLRAIRERHNMTQQELADAIDVTQPHVSCLEQDLDGVPLRLLRRLAQVFQDRARANSLRP